jgi:heme-degrading monooxygenase HmoA
LGETSHRLAFGCSSSLIPDACLLEEQVDSFLAVPQRSTIAEGIRPQGVARASHAARTQSTDVLWSPFYGQPMILEHAVLSVREGQEPEFEAAFRTASGIISGMSGFRGLTLTRCIECPSDYLLLVDWDTLTDHTIGFRESAEYQDWKALLHHFYEPFPTVRHFTEVLAMPGRG